MHFFFLATTALAASVQEVFPAHPLVEAPEQALAGSPHALALSKEEAARVARTLVSRELLANVASVYPPAHKYAGLPALFVEYYADCHGDGNPILLVVDIGTLFTNEAAGLALTLLIRTGDHQLRDRSNPHYPGGRTGLTAGLPRVLLHGALEHFTGNALLPLAERLALEQCFRERHPDSVWWFPRDVPLVHTTHWAKFVVDEVYMVGGFGDRAYIGPIEGELYHGAEEYDAGAACPGRRSWLSAWPRLSALVGWLV